MKLIGKKKEFLEKVNLRLSIEVWVLSQEGKFWKNG